MKKIAFVSLALAVLAGTPAFARVTHHQQQSWSQPQTDSGNYDPAKVRPGDVPFAVGARVASERWGEGTVQRYDGDQLTVLFDEHGYRDLLVPLVVERHLLTLAPAKGSPPLPDD